jgi:hypothetical protein
MSFFGNQDNVFEFLFFGEKFDDISGKGIPWIWSSTNNKMNIRNSHFDDLVIDGGIVKISSEQEKD